MTVWQRAAFFFHLLCPKGIHPHPALDFRKKSRENKKATSCLLIISNDADGIDYLQRAGGAMRPQLHCSSRFPLIYNPWNVEEKKARASFHARMRRTLKKKLLSNRGPSSKSAKSSVLRRNIAAIVHFFKVVCVCSTTNEIRRLSPEDMNPRAKTTRCQLQTVFIVAAFHFHLITKEELVLCLRGHWQCIVFRFFWSHFFHPPMRCS